MNRVATVSLVVGGTVAVAVGILGVFVPLLPTTPFLLLAAFLYARSSPRLHGWLLGNRLFGCYLRRYLERRTMSLRHKGITLAVLWFALGIGAAFAVTAWWARLLLAIVAVGVSAHLLWIATEPRSR